MKFLNEGFRSKAYKDESRIILVGQNENSFASFEKDAKILNLLRTFIKDLKTPNNVEVIKPCAKYLFGALSYDIIDGNILKPELINDNNIDSIVGSLSSFLKQLAEIDLSGFEPNYDAKKIIAKEKEYITKNMAILLPFVDDNIRNQLLNWQEKYYQYLDDEIKLNVTHGDLWYENMIIDESSTNLVGIIDFEHAGVFDKAIDYVPALYLGIDFTNKLLQASGLSLDYYKVLRLFAIRRQVIGFKYLVKHFPEEIDEEIEKTKSVLNDFLESVPRTI